MTDEIDEKDEREKHHRVHKILIGVIILFCAIFILKFIEASVLEWRIIQNRSQCINVTVKKITYALWPQTLNAVASLRAVNGINVTTEVPGIVQTIYFKPGAWVKKGEVLVQLLADNDIASLHALEANETLAQITYKRDLAQYQAVHAISQSVLDTDTATLKSTHALVEQQAAMILKKTIRAPFDGRLGVSAVNLGQYLNAGDPIVSLQSYDPIWADFYLPEQDLAKLSLGSPVSITTDTYPKQTFTGTLTTINAAVDIATRNIQVEATIKNAKHLLVPGMFAHAEIGVNLTKRFLTLPQNAVQFHPYGAYVFVVTKNSAFQQEREKTEDEEDEDNISDKNALVVKEAYVTTGETHDEEIAILSGLKEGDQVVISGQLKLTNGSPIVIDHADKIESHK